MPNRPLLLGHRGARALRSIPENTLESFDRALADGCDGFEFDVRLTADAVPVICHDPRIGGVEIAHASAVQLKHLARLEDVLSRYQERAFLDIELKVGGLEEITVHMLQQYPPRRGFVVSSFLPEVLLAVRANEPTVPLGLICETRAQLLPWKELPLEYVISRYTLATVSLVREVHGAGKKLFVWTVNNAAGMARLRDLGVDGLISDETELLSRTVAH